jgi:outer membrane protein
VFCIKILSRVATLTLIVSVCGRADTPIRTFGVGFFEGGPYPAHSEFRNQFRDQLQAMTPSGVKIAYFPDAFKSAEWNRETSRRMARELAADSHIDLVVALGPWTVEDLLAAGFDRPIIAALRFDPLVEGLVDSSGRSIANNVTVRLRPRKLGADFAYMADLLKPDTVAVLYFPSGIDSGVAVERMRPLGRQLGFEVVTAEGFDPEGAFAFFKAYRQLNRRGVDVLYLPPLWGLDPDMIRQFYAMAGRDGIATLSSEGYYHVTRGALAGGSVESPLVEAHFQAWKAARIIEGQLPADLPNVLGDNRGLYVNGQVALQLGISVAADRRYDMMLLEGPAADSVDRLTVVDAINIALSQNPGYLAVQQALEAAEQSASKAWAGYLPQLELDARAAYFNDNAVNNDNRYGNQRYRAGLNLNQELFSLGVLRDIHSASLERDQSGNAFRQAALDLELAVTTTFLDLVRLEQIRSVEQTNLRQMQECFQIASLRLNLRETDADNVWRSEQEWLDALRASRRTEYEYRVASVLLNTLLGRPGEYPFVADWQHFTDERFFAEESILTLVGQTPEQRERIVSALVGLADSTSPEINGSELDADLQRSRLSRVNADFYPRVGFFATFDVTDELAERSGFEEANPAWSMGARLTLPLFSGGRRIKERRQMQAELERRVFQKDETNQRVSSRVRSFLEKVYNRAEEFPMSARAAELADKCVPEVLTHYATGGRTLLELLDAVWNDRLASYDAITTQIEYFTSVAELMHTVGISAYESGRTPDEELMSRLRSMQSDSGR